MPNARAASPATTPIPPSGESGARDWFERFAAPGSGAPAVAPRRAQALLVGRSLAVGGLLAAGFAAALVAGHGGFEGMETARAAVPVAAERVARPVRIMPEAPLPEDLTASLPAVPEGETVGALDRVSSDYILEALLSQLGGDPNDILQFGPMKIRRHLVATIVKAAQTTGADPVLLMAIADKESSFATEVRAKTSSATGLFQFIDSTWLQTVKDFGERHGLTKEAQAVVRDADDDLTVKDPAERARILELRRDPALATLLAAEMLGRDRRRIAGKIGRDLTHGETYLIHFLGPDDAGRFLDKVANQPKTAAASLLPRPARANRGIFFARAGRKTKSRSVAEVHQKFEAMMESRLARYREVHAAVGALGTERAVAGAEAKVTP